MMIQRNSEQQQPSAHQCVNHEQCESSQPPGVWIPAVWAREVCLGDHDKAGPRGALFALASFMSDSGSDIWRKSDTLRAAASMGRDAWHNHTTALVAAGVITRERFRRSDGTQGPWIYKPVRTAPRHAPVVETGATDEADDQLLETSTWTAEPATGNQGPPATGNQADQLLETRRAELSCELSSEVSTHTRSDETAPAPEPVAVECADMKANSAQDDQADFSAWWENFPEVKRQPRLWKACRHEFLKAISSGAVTADELTQAVNVMQRDVWADKAPRFTTSPLVFLQEQRWQDPAVVAAAEQARDARRPDVVLTAEWEGMPSEEETRTAQLAGMTQQQQEDWQRMWEGLKAVWPACEDSTQRGACLSTWMTYVDSQQAPAVEVVLDAAREQLQHDGEAVTSQPSHWFQFTGWMVPVH